LLGEGAGDARRPELGGGVRRAVRQPRAPTISPTHGAGQERRLNARGGSLKAAEGIRTLDLLHGKQNVGFRLRADFPMAWTIADSSSAPGGADVEAAGPAVVLAPADPRTALWAHKARGPGADRNHKPHDRDDRNQAEAEHRIDRDRHEGDEGRLHRVPTLSRMPGGLKGFVTGRATRCNARSFPPES
jgi:hypothetical protein